MSSDYWVTPIRRLNNRLVATPLPVDFASVEYIVSDTNIAEAWKKGLKWSLTDGLEDDSECATGNSGATEAQNP